MRISLRRNAEFDLQDYTAEPKAFGFDSTKELVFRLTPPVQTPNLSTEGRLAINLPRRTPSTANKLKIKYRFSSTDETRLCTNHQCLIALISLCSV